MATVLPQPGTAAAGAPPAPASAPARLLISCADRPGIVAAVAGFLHGEGANITDSSQHSTDPYGGRFFMRMEFVRGGLQEDAAGFAARFEQAVGLPLGLDWSFAWPWQAKRLAILVSRYDHCALDLLWRWRRGELPCEVVAVVSNHPDLRASVEPFGVPFEVVPVPAGGKQAAEERMLELLSGRCDVVVLARYMQILSGAFLDRLGVPVINIHHSFLPAFAGAQPYRRARERGVKLIGATAHYVTEELDAGPIIEQDAERVTHADGLDALERIGADIERTVLSRAVLWHLQDRVVLDGSRTVVF
ncbi:MAG TPA: formyltetrahydrofolate deformylase [Solirubrobacteraceae bacterium]|nr:formyltetrahydrofolate deformylase [Solirubrobacteraceae bacterium]